MAAEHGGAMAVGGEARGGSTYARRAVQARVRLEGGRGRVAGGRNRGMVRWCGSSTPAELRARRVQSLGLSALEKKEGSAGWSERAHWLRQVKAGAWARGQAVAAARRATPAHGRHAAEGLCRGRRVDERPAGERRGAGPRRAQRASGGRCWADSRGGLTRWAGEARGWRGHGPGRLRSWAGKLSGGLLSEMKFFSFYFSNKQN